MPLFRRRRPAPDPQPPAEPLRPALPEAPPTAPAPDPLSVVVAPEIAEALTAGGRSLQRAVDGVLRAHLAALSAPEPTPAPAATPTPAAGAASKAEEPSPSTEGAGNRPFWLDREEQSSPEGRGDIEDELRDRVIHRRSDEGDG